MATLPALYIPHGGGPCFFMDDPHGIWSGMERFLADLPASLPAPPRAILVVSAHWEGAGFGLTGAAAPTLLYDYYGFPEHTYRLAYSAPGAPALAARAADLLGNAGLPAHIDSTRGFDHGVFVPLKVAWPEADVPVVAMGLDRSLDPAIHLAAGAALAPLREEGVLLIGSGMSFHNLRAMGDARLAPAAAAFDGWLQEVTALSGPARAAALARWEEAPSARLAHSREEHLLPLMVAAGSSVQPGATIYHEALLGNAVSGFAFP